MALPSLRISAFLSHRRVFPRRRRRRRGFPHPRLASRTHEDPLPSPGPRQSELHRRVGNSRQDVAGGRLERLHEGKWDQLHTHRPLQRLSICCLHYLQTSKSPVTPYTPFLPRPFAEPFPNGMMEADRPLAFNAKGCHRINDSITFNCRRHGRNHFRDDDLPLRHN